jgi:putative ABC transport system permease protein
VNPDYFRALEIPLKRGRYFTDGDRAGAPEVVLVNESFAGCYLPGKEPVGQRIRCGEPEGDWNWKTIVGVVGDVREPGRGWGDFASGTYRLALPSRDAPRVYFCYLQKPDSGMGLALRTQGDPSALAMADRSRLRSLDPDQIVRDVKTMDQCITESVYQQRANMWLSGAFGALALLLAAVGICGMLSFAVAQRTHEIGVRMALGARTGDIVRKVVLHGLRLTLLNLVQ